MRAVVFDWGGTLTPYHDVDLLDLWRVAAVRLAPERADELAAALYRAEREWWAEAVRTGRSGTTDEVLGAAFQATGIDVEPLLRDTALAEHRDAWTPHTLTDPDAARVLLSLRERGVAIGLLSNTHWPREWHEHWLARDGVLDLFDARVYTSDLEWVKPHPPVFHHVLERLGVADPATAVMVGDRPHDDIAGAKGVGMRAVLLPNQHVPAYDVVPDAVITALPQLLDVLAGW